ncbi:hypothetical protein [Halalkalibacter oceani]|uniref:hypothetical protein n=1 Tax=Halalkalibacter oceani TaxID=1653776 RepID=UPI00339B14E3
MKSFLYSLLLSAGSYVFLILLAVVTAGQAGLVQMAGFIAAVIFFLSAVPFHRALYHGSRGAEPTYTAYVPPDEHLHERMAARHKEPKSAARSILLFAAANNLIITIILALIF